MKQQAAITLIGIFLLAAVAGAQTVTLSQSVDPNSVDSAVSVGCNNVGITGQNSWYRAYDLTGEGVVGDVLVTGARFGVAQAAAGSGGSQPVEVRIYRDPNPGGLAPSSGLQLLRTEFVTVADQTNSTVVVTFGQPLYVANVASDDIVIELFAADGTAAGHAFFAGLNSLGQTDSSYFSSTTCGIMSPIDLAILGFTSSHLILDLIVEPAPVVPPQYPGTDEDLITEWSVDLQGFQPVIGGLDVIALPLSTFMEVRHSSPNGTFVGSMSGQFLAFGSVVPTAGTPGNVGQPLPGLFVDLGTVFVVNNPIGGQPPQLPSVGFSYAFSHPGPLASGLSLILQGLALSSFFSANNIYSTTDGLEIQLL